MAYGFLFSALALVLGTDSGPSEIDGKWQFVSVCVDGKSQVPDGAGEQFILLEQGRLAEIDEPDADKPPGNAPEDSDDESDEQVECVFRLKPDADPKQMDLVHVDADGKEIDCWKCIYRVDGQELQICSSIADAHQVVCCGIPEGPEIDGSVRPTDFDPAGHVVITWKRVKPSAEQSP